MPTNTRREQVENLLRDPDFRRQFVSDYVQAMVATQIRAIREKRTWTQEQLGTAAGGMKQVQVSRLENPDYSGASVKSIIRIVQAFDMGLIVRIAPISDVVDWIVSTTPEKVVPDSYTEEQAHLAALSEQKRNQALMVDTIAAELLGDDYGAGKRKWQLTGRRQAAAIVSDTTALPAVETTLLAGGEKALEVAA